MKKVDYIIHPKWIIPINQNAELLTQSSVIIDNGKILCLLPTAEANQKYTSENTTTLENHVILPGFINCHTHTPMNLFRGLADDLPLMDWLTQHIWPAEQKIINPQTTKLGSQLAIAEMIRGGTTCFNDHYLFPESTAEAVIESGIRATLGLLVFNVPTLWSNDEAEALDKAEKILKKRFDQDPNIHWSIAPHAPYSVSDRSLQRIKELSEQYHIPIHIHLHETLNEIEMSIKEHGVRPIQRFKNLGLLNDKLIAVHMVHVNQEDLDLIKESGAHVVHCPESNLKLGTGFAPISTYQKSQMNIGLGTDGAASNNDLDMIGEMRTASLIAKAKTQDPTQLDAHSVLKMATLNGAKALGIDHLTGSLEAGKQADITAFDLSDYWQQPVYNPIAHLVYSGNRLSVSDVWVSGKRLLKNKKLTTIDTTVLQDELNKITGEIKPLMTTP
jgi:5-methylthioadenosine/S-adenosylhomocysteine deaminase